MTLDALAVEFHKNYMIKRLRQTTISGYNVNLKNHVLPIIGMISLEELHVSHLDQITDELQDKGLSNKSIVYCHAVTRKMLNYAVKRGYISVNPYAMFDLPRIQQFRYTVITPEQLQILAEAARDRCPDMYPAIILAGFYGMRRGEVLGVIPSRDYRGGVLSVERTRTVIGAKTVITPCKTDHSQRQLLIAPEHREIFACCPIGSYLVEFSPCVLNNGFRRLLALCDMPPMRFHDLRHSYATWMLAENVNPKIVSAVLGHANVGITLDIYSHPNVSMQAACLDAMHRNNKKPG